MKKTEAVETLDVESLIVDLLACGLGACIILFFIFSIKIIGRTVSATEVSAAERKPGNGAGYVALIGDNGDPKKRMGAVRVIEFSGLSNENLRLLKEAAATPDPEFWGNFKFFSGRDTISKALAQSIRIQTQVHRDNVSFIFYADGMRELVFTFPDALKQQLENTRASNALVKVYALEGKSRKGAFMGYYQSNPYKIADLKNLKITIKTGKASGIGKLTKIEGGS